MLSPAKLLTHRKLRVTVARLSVLELFQTHPRLSPKEIYRLLDRSERTLSIASVHRVLAELCEAKLLERHYLSSGVATFSLLQSRSVVHLVCERCGVVSACEGMKVHSLLLKLTEAEDFAMLASTVSVRGTCATCRARG